LEDESHNFFLHSWHFLEVKKILRLQRSKCKNVGQENPWQPFVEVPIEEEPIPKPYNFRAKCEYCVAPLIRCSITQRQPTQRLIEYLNFGSTSTSCELTSFNEEALTNETINKWKQAMDEEYQIFIFITK
jgi:hypothetical protein